MRDDLKAAFRSLRSSKEVALAALIVLTLGIGATTAIFSVVDAVVLSEVIADYDVDVSVAVDIGERRSGRVPLLGRPADQLLRDELRRSRIERSAGRCWQSRRSRR